MKTIAMVLTPNVVDSQVVVDGVDISSSIRGVEIRAWVGEPLRVTLTLIARVELMADVDQLTIYHPAQGEVSPGQGTDRGNQGTG